MMQSLLAERFRLIAHFERQQAPVLALTLIRSGKLGPQLHPHSEGPPCDMPDLMQPQNSKTSKAPVFPPACDVFELGQQDRLALAGSRNTTIEYIAGWLGTNLKRPVVDQTGLSGRYDFTIQWTPEQGDPIAPGTSESAESKLQGTTFLEAIREQLGLNVESTKALIPILVVDHVERPSEN